MEVQQKADVGSAGRGLARYRADNTLTLLAAAVCYLPSFGACMILGNVGRSRAIIGAHRSFLGCVLELDKDSRATALVQLGRSCV